MKLVIKTAENCEEEIHAMAYVILHCAARFGNTGNSEVDRWNIQLGLNMNSSVISTVYSRINIIFP